MVGFGSLLGGVGSLVGAFGAGKDSNVTRTPEGYQSLSPEIQQYMTSVLLPQIKAQAATPFEGIPMRPLNESDLDPVFGSSERVRYALANAASSVANKQAQPKAEKSSTSNDAMREEMLGRQLAEKRRYNPAALSNEDFRLLYRLDQKNSSLSGIDTSKLRYLAAAPRIYGLK